MVNHPFQRKIYTLDAVEYKHVLNCNLKSLELEYGMYKERGDKESCAEIRLEYKYTIHELLTFGRALTRSNKYHKDKV